MYTRCLSASLPVNDHRIGYSRSPPLKNPWSKMPHPTPSRLENRFRKPVFGNAWEWDAAPRSADRMPLHTMDPNPLPVTDTVRRFHFVDAWVAGSCKQHLNARNPKMGCWKITKVQKQALGKIKAGIELNSCRVNMFNVKTFHETFISADHRHYPRYTRSNVF